MCAADVLAWGTPVYRHGMTGALKTVIERMNDEPTKRNRPDCPGRRQYVNAPLYPAWAERTTGGRSRSSGQSGPRSLA